MTTPDMTTPDMTTPDMTLAELSLIEYPLDFPLKIVGVNQPGFAETVMTIVRRHAPDLDPATITLRPSRKSAYLSVTCVIRAQSREQLDALYRELSEHSMVKWTL